MKLDYIQRLTLGVTFAKENLPAGFHETQVFHDEWCAIFDGKKCSCIPDINVTINNKKFYIDEDGVLHSIKVN